jgi:hypothetical protein
LVTVASNLPFFALFGPTDPNKVVRVRRIFASLPTLGSATHKQISLVKYKNQLTGGTPTNLGKISLDSSAPASDAAICAVYATAPTVGNMVGVIGARRVNMQDTSPAGTETSDFADFDFRDGPITLHNANEGVCLQMDAVTGSFSISVEAEWSEE